tara:strand:- start:383 stop:736 length:354 start_codon:yes stop_codon:yes gene_type:complete
MIFIKIGIMICAFTVILGAFGAHSLEKLIGDKTETFKTGIQYQMFHSLGLIIIGILSKFFEIDLNTSGYLMISGIILFSGSLYLISIFKLTYFGIVAPLGGLCFIFGWLYLFYKISL